MFRKNYLPRMKIIQDFDTKKWFAYTPGDAFSRREFIQTDDGDYMVSMWGAKPTKFETLDDLIAALYEYAYKEHLEKIKAELTHNTIKINT